MDIADPSDPEVKRLIDEHPLAWVIAHGPAGFRSTLLPLLAEVDAGGRLVSLLGHFALRNTQIEQLRAAPFASILFLGPNSYVSPEYVSLAGWGPTWNYASAQFEVKIEFLPHDADTALQRLVDHMERARRNPWTIVNMGARYDQLKQRILAFRAHISSMHARFKLGQDESAETLGELLVNLPDQPLVDWMRRHNAGR